MNLWIGIEIKHRICKHHLTEFQIMHVVKLQYGNIFFSMHNWPCGLQFLLTNHSTYGLIAISASETATSHQQKPERGWRPDPFLSWHPVLVASDTQNTFKSLYEIPSLGWRQPTWMHPSRRMRYPMSPTCEKTWFTTLRRLGRLLHLHCSQR